VNIGYDVKADDVKVSPFATGQFTRVDVNAFNETGSLAPLSFVGQGEAYLSTQLGTQASVKWNIDGFKLSPNVSAGWEHVYDGNADSLKANFGSGSNFTSSGSLTGTDAAVLGGGLQAEVDKDINAHVEYQGKVGMTNYTAQAISGGVNIGF
jgi:outer membrane autotransporter protein